jgi:hypothetical protein
MVINKKCEGKDSEQPITGINDHQTSLIFPAILFLWHKDVVYLASV